MLDRLDRDHAGGERAIRELEQNPLGFEMIGDTDHGEARRARFEESMQGHVDFYLDHRRVEETQVLPLAERVLTEPDWLELDAAFPTHRDPLTGHEVEGAYRPLLTKIRMATPAPIGLGSALEALSGVGVARHASGR